jgi:hypothetical protein
MDPFEYDFQYTQQVLGEIRRKRAEIAPKIEDVSLPEETRRDLQAFESELKEKIDAIEVDATVEMGKKDNHFATKCQSISSLYNQRRGLFK